MTIDGCVSSYMAPEFFASKDSTASGLSDVYALGITMIEMLFPDAKCPSAMQIANDPSVSINLSMCPDRNLRRLLQGNHKGVL